MVWHLPKLDYNFCKFIHQILRVIYSLPLGEPLGKDLWHRYFYAPFEKGGHTCIALHVSVCRYVGLLNLVQLITQEHFAPEASNLLGR